MRYKERAYLDHMAVFVKDIQWSISFFEDVFSYVRCQDRRSL